MFFSEHSRSPDQESVVNTTGDFLKLFFKQIIPHIKSLSSLFSYVWWNYDFIYDFDSKLSEWKEKKDLSRPLYLSYHVKLRRKIIMFQVINCFHWCFFYYFLRYNCTAKDYLRRSLPVCQETFWMTSITHTLQFKYFIKLIFTSINMQSFSTDVNQNHHLYYQHKLSLTLKHILIVMYQGCSNYESGVTLAAQGIT